MPQEHPYVKSYDLPIFRWPRAASYAIADGGIEPTDEESTATQPWRDFEEWRTVKPSEAVAPYQGLLDLATRCFESLQSTGNQKRLLERNEVPSKLEAEITAWCAKHGLLGILPQRIHSVYRQPTWERNETGTLVPTIESAHRTSLGWQHGCSVEVDRWTELLQKHLDRLKPEEGEPVFTRTAPPGWPSDWVEIAPLTMKTKDIAEIIQYRRWRNRECPSTASAEYFDQYFIPQPDSGDALSLFPLPGTEHFWDRYREPLAEFVIAATRFASGAKAYVQLHEHPADSLDSDEMQALDFFQALARSVGLGAPAEGQEYAPMTFAPSLLAAYAYMITMDTARLKLVMVCPECGKLFASRARRVIYCSVRCQARVSKRRVKSKSD